MCEGSRFGPYTMWFPQNYQRGPLSTELGVAPEHHLVWPTRLENKNKNNALQLSSPIREMENSIVFMAEATGMVHGVVVGRMTPVRLAH